MAARAYFAVEAFMLSKEEFVQWSRSLNLSDQAKALVERVRASPPARRVGGGSGNVSGRYPSRKMGVTIQFESHRGELAGIYELEHDSDVVEYYDQPYAIKLSYIAKSERTVGVMHTPDFFVLRRGSAGWEECKTEEDLLRLADRMPRRYVRQEGQWRCPPGESYAQQFGLYYRLRSSSQIDWTYQRNIQFLEDYLRADAPLVSDRCREIVQSYLEEEKVIVLSELLERVRAVRMEVDVIYALIATGRLHVDLSAAPLVEPWRVQVFRDQKAADLYRNMTRLTTEIPAHSPLFIDLTAGARLSWDGKQQTIINLGDSTVSLMGEDGAFVDLPITLFEELVRQGKLTGVQAQIGVKHNAEAGRLLSEASPHALAEANRRYEVIWAQLHGEGGDFGSVPKRTARRWLAGYRKAEQLYGCGYIGLIPRHQLRGNRRSKLPEETRELMGSFIEQDYETLKQKTKSQVHASLQKECESRGLLAPSYRTFTQATNRRPHHEQNKKRQGKRAAYKYEEFYWELELTTPRHGDRPFEIAHLDHSELDVELVSSLTGSNLGRPWATFLTDAFSRRLLAFALTFESPSYRSCMVVLRECVRRHGRLPQILVVDGGAEFSSIYFETLLAWYEVVKKQRPAGKARFGAVCERLFGTTNTRFIHNLQGNTQMMRHVRQVTKAINPKTHASWTLERLFQRMCEWADEVYDTIEHPALGQSPREAYAQGMLQSGSRPHRLIPYDSNFLMLTLPTTSRGVAKVTPGKGVKINYIYYWSTAFRDPAVENTLAPVRYDPYDAGLAYAFVAGRWVKCLSEHYSVFQGRSEKEVRVATEELRQRSRMHSIRGEITARKLANFLASVEAEESLAVQRMRDAEARAVFRLIEGGGPALTGAPKLTEEEPEQTRQTGPAATGDREFELEIYEEY
jgi:putative transposase